MDLERTIIALPLLLISAPLTAAGLDVFELRNQHPFLHIYGLPALQQAILVERGQPDYSAVLSIVNNSEIKDAETESIVLDGETYFADFRYRRRVHDRLEIGVDVPLVKHSQGFLDRMIYDWHDFWGISNSKRGEPHNQLDYSYEINGSVQQQKTASSFGVGDIQLSAAMPLVTGGEAGSRHVSVRFSVKLPTGDSADIHGSGAADAALGIYAQDSGQLFGRELAYLGSRACWDWVTATCSQTSNAQPCLMAGWRRPGTRLRVSASRLSCRRRVPISTVISMNWVAVRFN